MSRWPWAKARDVPRALERIGWKVKRQSGSHKTLARDGYADVVFAFHDRDEIGPKMIGNASCQLDASEFSLSPHAWCRRALLRLSELKIRHC
jgi:predicted RNA binding protein YcfA (HicA-like mRNA interferase family)